ncbi:hypothetical protein [Nostoc sp.]
MKRSIIDVSIIKIQNAYKKLESFFIADVERLREAAKETASSI